MDKLKENIASILASSVLTAIVFLGGIYGVLNSVQKNDNLAGGYFFVNSIRSANATTTNIYLSTTATTTRILNIDRISDYDLNIVANASTTASKLAWSFEFSNNYNENCRIGVICAGTGNGDWFGETNLSDDNTIATTHGARTREHMWAMATSTAFCGQGCFTANFGTPDIRAKFVKIHLAARDANLGVWFEFALKEPSSR